MYKLMCAFPAADTNSDPLSGYRFLFVGTEYAVCEPRNALYMYTYIIILANVSINAYGKVQYTYLSMSSLIHLEYVQ